MSLGHNGDDEITVVLSRQVLDSVMRERVPVTQGPVSVIREPVAVALTQALVYLCDSGNRVRDPSASCL